jgi:hypothetical protein
MATERPDVIPAENPSECYTVMANEVYLTSFRPSIGSWDLQRHPDWAHGSQCKVQRLNVVFRHIGDTVGQLRIDAGALLGDVRRCRADRESRVLTTRIPNSRRRAQTELTHGS